MRLIDADAYSAEMKVKQDACLELLNSAKRIGDEETCNIRNAACCVFVEAKLTLDKMPTVYAAW